MRVGLKEEISGNLAGKGFNVLRDRSEQVKFDILLDEFVGEDRVM